MFHQLTYQNMYYIDNSFLNGVPGSTFEDMNKIQPYLYYFHYHLEFIPPNYFDNYCKLQMESLPQQNQDTNHHNNDQNQQIQGQNDIQGKKNKLEAEKMPEELCFRNKQKFGRNILSNIFHLMVKSVSSQKNLLVKIEKIIQMHNMAIKPKQFSRIMKKMKSKLSTYATTQQIQQFLQGNLWKTQNSNSKNQECSKIFRILGRLYLEHNHMPYVYHSNKIKKESKILHVAGIRKIYQSMN